MRRCGAAVVVATALLLSLVLVGGVRAADAPAAGRGAAYLATTQGPDGSVPTGWRADQVAETVVALVAGGGQPASVDRAIGFLEHNADAGASSGPYAGRIVAALVAAGRDPRRFAGVDLVARTESFHDPVSGSYGGNLYGDAMAMLGLLSAGRPLPDTALNRIRLNQCRDGGWTHQSGCVGQADTDTTSAALAVLAASTGTATTEVRAARSWLATHQGTSGCWGHNAGAPDNANSCGLAISAVLALRERLDAPPWAAGGRNAIAALRGLQLESGAFQYRKDVAGPNDYATVQAVPALAGWAYPVRGPAAPSAPRGTTTTVPHAGDDGEVRDAAPPAGGGVAASTSTTTRTGARQASRPPSGSGVVTTRTGSGATATSTSGSASAGASNAGSARSKVVGGDGSTEAASGTAGGNGEVGLDSGPISRAGDGTRGSGRGISPLGPVIELLTLAVVIVTFRWRWKMRRASRT